MRASISRESKHRPQQTSLACTRLIVELASFVVKLCYCWIRGNLLRNAPFPCLCSLNEFTVTRINAQRSIAIVITKLALKISELSFRRRIYNLFRLRILPRTIKNSSRVFFQSDGIKIFLLYVEYRSIFFFFNFLEKAGISAFISYESSPHMGP